MRYIKVWSDLESVPQELRGDVIPLVGTYFCLDDVIEAIDMEYGESAWEALSPQEQDEVIEAADVALESIGMGGFYGWDEIIRDTIGGKLPEVQAKLEAFEGS